MAELRDIAVTIPADRLQDVELEEAEVAARWARGERDIMYWWSLGRLPRTLPRRIYFVWDGAVRACHEVISMAGDRIYMRPEIRKIEPIPTKGFRGFRYWPERGARS